MKLSRPENYFLVVILLVGLMAVVVTPFGAGFDEETHVARIWEMSAGVLLPNRLLGAGDEYPRAFYDVSYRQYKNLTPVSRDMWARQLEVKIGSSDRMAYETRSVLFPLVYAPQAVLMALLARVLDAPVSLIYYLLRASYLAVYAILVYFAVRLIPTGKWILAVLALSPASIVLASTISPDSTTMGAAMLFLAWMLMLSTRPPSPLSRGEILLTLGLVILVASMKIAVLFVGVLVLLRPRDFSSRRAWAAFAVSVVLLVAAVFVAWTYAVSLQTEFAPAIEAADPLAQARFVLGHPGAVAGAVWGDLVTHAGRYLQEMIGVSGYAYWKMPAFVYWLYPALVLFALLRESAGSSLDRRRRAVLLGVGLVHTLGVMMVLYLTLSPVGSQEIIGIQGRYFLPGLPYLLLGLTPASAFIRSGEISVRIVSAGIAVIAVAALGLAYHVVCGESYYSLGVCHLPKYKNWDPQAGAAMPVSGDHRITQDFEAVCSPLTEFRVWIADRGATPAESMLVELTQMDEGRLVASEVVSQEVLRSNDWSRLAFPPVVDSDRRRFEVSIRPLDIGRQQSIAVGWTETDEYFEGRAELDGDDLHGDLIFQYGCRVGLEALRPR